MNVTSSEATSYLGVDHNRNFNIFSGSDQPLMQITRDGVVSFPKAPFTDVYLSKDLCAPPSTENHIEIPFKPDVAQENRGGYWDFTSGSYKPKVSGTYLVDAAVLVKGLPEIPASVDLIMNVAGKIFPMRTQTVGDQVTAMISRLVQLDADEIITFLVSVYRPSFDESAALVCISGTEPNGNVSNIYSSATFAKIN